MYLCVKVIQVFILINNQTFKSQKRDNDIFLNIIYVIFISLRKCVLLNGTVSQVIDVVHRPLVCPLCLVVKIRCIYM